MEYYYLNKNEQPEVVATHAHEHELHRKECKFFPENTVEFGPYDTSEDALLAVRIWAAMNHNDWNIDGCAECCPEIDSDRR